jgi:hypothetical protein
LELFLGKIGTVIRSDVSIATASKFISGNFFNSNARILCHGHKLKTASNACYRPKERRFPFMEKILTMTSQTLAIKAKRLLDKQGIYVRIVRPSPQKTPKGCAFGLQTDARLISYMIYYLEQEKIPFGEVIDL